MIISQTLHTNILSRNEILQRRSMSVNACFWTGASQDHLLGVHLFTIHTGQSYITKVAFLSKLAGCHRRTFLSRMHLILIHGKLVGFHNPHNVAPPWLYTCSFTNNFKNMSELLSSSLSHFVSSKSLPLNRLYLHVNVVVPEPPPPKVGTSLILLVPLLVIHLPRQRPGP